MMFMKIVKNTSKTKCIGRELLRVLLQTFLNQMFTMRSFFIKDIFQNIRLYSGEIVTSRLRLSLAENDRTRITVL